MGCRSGDYGNISRSGSEAATGYATAGDLVGGEGLAVFVGEVEEAVRLGGLFQPVDESFHLSVDDFLCASETDVDDYEGHVGDSDVAFRPFPQTKLDVSAVVEIVDTRTDRVPVE